MKISTEIDSSAKHVGDFKAVELVAKAGFDAWDFSMFDMAKYNWSTKGVTTTDSPLSTGDYIGFSKELRKIGVENGNDTGGYIVQKLGRGAVKRFT